MIFFIYLTKKRNLNEHIKEKKRLGKEIPTVERRKALLESKRPLLLNIHLIPKHWFVAIDKLPYAALKNQRK